MKIVVIILIYLGIHVISQKKQAFLPFPSSFGWIAFLVGPTQKLSFLPSLMINQTKESRIFQSFSPSSFFPSSFSQTKHSVNYISTNNPTQQPNTMETSFPKQKIISRQSLHLVLQ
jgi:hypothetical protein